MLRRWSGVALAGMIVSSFAVVMPDPVRAAGGPVGTVTTYTDATIATPSAITSGPDGALWFANADNNSIGRISTTGTITNYTDPTMFNPHGIASGPDGALWFTNTGNNSIGRITTTGTVTNYPLPPLTGPSAITAGPDGALWFTNIWANWIGRITTSGIINSYVDASIVNAYGITVGPDGALWFTNAGAGKGSIGRITTGGDITTFTDPTMFNPYGIASGSDGALWFTNNGNNSIGRITTTGIVTNFTDPTFSALHGIVSGPDGALWFGNTGNNSIGRITTTGTVTNYTGPTVVYPAAITAGPDGALWFTDLGNSIGRITTGAVTTPKNYVALGDSYSSGEGAAVPPVTSGSDANFYLGTDTANNQCHRSHNAYPDLLKQDLSVTTYGFHACSGALLSEMANQLNKDNNNPLKEKYSGQWDEPAQLDHLALATGPQNPNIDLVTLSIGGNDAGFVQALMACVHGFTRGLANKDCTLANLQSKMNQAVESFKYGKRELVWADGTWTECGGCSLGPRHKRFGFDYQDGYVVDVPSLHGLYEEIHRRAPQAKIRVIGYPHLFRNANPTVPASNQACFVGGKSGLKYWLNEGDLANFWNLANQLDDTIRDEVAIASAPGSDIQFVDTRPVFAHHSLCDDGESWINGGMVTNTLKPSPYSFHPNTKGQQAFETAVRASL